MNVLFLSSGPMKKMKKKIDMLTFRKWIGSADSLLLALCWIKKGFCEAQLSLGKQSLSSLSQATNFKDFFPALGGNSITTSSDEGKINGDIFKQ